MIFLTVGTHTQPFNRLLMEIDKLIEQKVIREKVIAQIGYSTYIPKNYKYFSFTREEKIIELIKKSSIIISHAGAGSIIIGLKFKKPLIVIPRRKAFNEHFDDHQVQIAKEFKKQGKVLVAYDVNQIGELIKIAKTFKPNLKNKKKIKIFKLIESFLCKNYKV